MKILPSNDSSSDLFKKYLSKDLGETKLLSKLIFGLFKTKFASSSSSFIYLNLNLIFTSSYLNYKKYLLIYIYKINYLLIIFFFLNVNIYIK